MESLGINFAKVSDSVEKIREQAETFVNRGKDAWNLHYAETETALRQRSDAALQHVTDLQVLKRANIWIWEGTLIFQTLYTLLGQNSKAQICISR